jgi:hypothetical protein
MEGIKKRMTPDPERSERKGYRNSEFDDVNEIMN